MGTGEGEAQGAVVAGRDGWSGQDWLTWRRTMVDGRPAFYGEAGEGPPAVFLHGWGLDHKSYKRALARLVRAGVHVLAPAMPGFGGTAALPGEAMNLGGYGDWVAEFMRTVGVREPALMLGHSFGGGVAILAAHDHPTCVRSLVLINSIGGSTWQPGNTLRDMLHRPPWDWGIHLAADLLPGRQASRVIPVIVGEALPNLIRDPRAFWKAGGLARRADLSSELETLRRRHMPVAVLWGQRDRVVSRKSFDDLCRALGQPDVVTLPGSHSWMLADPDSFGEVMTNVLAVFGMATAEEAVEVTA